jgi:excisionase family DNA binding protein
MTEPNQPPPGRDPDVLTTAELATKLGLSPQTIRRMANAGQLPALKTGKDFRYSWTAVKEVLRQPHHESGGPADDHDEHDTDQGRKGAGFRAQRQAHQQASSTDPTGP